jgi:hypothetical protein
LVGVADDEVAVAVEFPVIVPFKDVVLAVPDSTVAVALDVDVVVALLEPELDAAAVAVALPGAMTLERSDIVA